MLKLFIVAYSDCLFNIPFYSYFILLMLVVGIVVSNEQQSSELFLKKNKLIIGFE